MVAAFNDHFSQLASGYGRYRPGYPAGLFKYLAGTVGRCGLAWDCATGSGQAALGLAQHFDRVVATDASQAQIAHALPHAKIAYAVSVAERTPILSRSIDLIAVAQALHWLDRTVFFKEAMRTLKPDGVIAVWSYNLLRVDPKVDQIVNDFYTQMVGGFWPAERRWVEQGYVGVDFPFADQPVPDFRMTATWTLHRLMGYLGTWSGVQRYREHHGRDPLDTIRSDLESAWGDPGVAKAVRWSLSLRVGRVKR